MKKLTISLLLYLFIMPLFGQNVRTIRGIVIDELLRRPIDSAQVTTNTTLSSTLTNAEGQFTITLQSTNKNDTLFISKEGYQGILKPLSKKKNFYEIYWQEEEPQLNFKDDDDVLELNTVFVADEKVKLIDPFLHISLDSALSLAKNENKQVLVYFTAKWCGFCKLMDKKTFQQDSIIQLLENEVIALKVNIDAFEGEKLVKEFTISGYPTFIMLTPEKLVTNRNVGINFYETAYTDPTGITKFIEEGYAYNQTESVGVTKEEYERMEYKRKEHERLRIGFNFVTHFNTLKLGEETKSSTNFEYGLFAQLNKKRFSFRTGVSYLSNKLDHQKFSSLLIPVTLGYSVYKGQLFSLKSKIKAYIVPFYQYNFVKDEMSVNTSNFGMRYGLEYDIGGDSFIGLFFAYEQYFNDYFTDISAKQNGFSVGAVIAIPSK